MKVKVGLSYERKYMGWGGFENIVLRKIFAPNANEATTDGGNFITTSFIVGTPRQML